MKLLRVLRIVLYVSCFVFANNSVQSNKHTSDEDKWNTDSQCDVLKKFAFEDGEKLILEYIKRDSRGDFLKTDLWLDTAVECPSFLSGPDEFVLIRDYKIGNVSKSDKKITVNVKYQKIGRMGQNSLGSILMMDTTSFEVRVTAIRTDYGWRIKHPSIRLNVLLTRKIGKEYFPNIVDSIYEITNKKWANKR